MNAGRHGIVYLVDLYTDGFPGNSGPRYDGYWDSGTEPGQLLEQGPGWDDPEDAVGWGRQRAPKVILRVGDQFYSAGDEDPEGDNFVRWERA